MELSEFERLSDKEQQLVTRRALARRYAMRPDCQDWRIGHAIGCWLWVDPVDYDCSCGRTAQLTRSLNRVQSGRQGSAKPDQTECAHGLTKAAWGGVPEVCLECGAEVHSGRNGAPDGPA